MRQGYGRTFTRPMALSWCSICGRDSFGLWCDVCLEPFIVKGQAFQPTISYSGPLAATAALARAIVQSGAHIVIAE